MNLYKSSDIYISLPFFMGKTNWLFWNDRCFFALSKAYKYTT